MKKAERGTTESAGNFLENNHAYRDVYKAILSQLILLKHNAYPRGVLIDIFRVSFLRCRKNFALWSDLMCAILLMSRV